MAVAIVGPRPMPTYIVRRRSLPEAIYISQCVAGGILQAVAAVASLHARDGVAVAMHAAWGSAVIPNVCRGRKRPRGTRPRRTRPKARDSAAGMAKARSTLTNGGSEERVTTPAHVAPPASGRDSPLVAGWPRYGAERAACHAR